MEKGMRNSLMVDEAGIPEFTEYTASESRKSARRALWEDRGPKIKLKPARATKIALRADFRLDTAR